MKYVIRAPKKSSIVLKIDGKTYTYRHGKVVDEKPFFKKFPAFFIPQVDVNITDNRIPEQLPTQIHPLKVAHKGGGWYVVERNDTLIHPTEGKLRKDAAENYIKENE